MKLTVALPAIVLLALLPLLSGCGDTGVNGQQVAGTLNEADRYYSLGDMTKAHRWLENGIALMPGNPQTYFGPDDAPEQGAISIAVNHGDYHEVIKIAGAAKHQKGLSGSVEQLDGVLGDAYDHLDQKAQAQAAYRDEVADIVKSTTTAGAKLGSPSAPPLMLRKGEAEWLSGDHVAGRRDILEVKATNKDYETQASNDLAYFEAVAGENLSEADTLARYAVSVAEKADDAPLAAEYQDTLGWTLYKVGQYKESLYWLQLANDEIPEESDVTMHLATVYEALRQTAAARAEYLRVESMQPFSPEAKAGLARVSAAV